MTRLKITPCTSNQQQYCTPINTVIIQMGLPHLRCTLLCGVVSDVWLFEECYFSVLS